MGFEINNKINLYVVSFHLRTIGLIFIKSYIGDPYTNLSDVLIFCCKGWHFTYEPKYRLDVTLLMNKIPSFLPKYLSNIAETSFYYILCNGSCK
jgi:hypothetical protein